MACNRDIFTFYLIPYQLKLWTDDSNMRRQRVMDREECGRVWLWHVLRYRTGFAREVLGNTIEESVSSRSEFGPSNFIMGARLVTATSWLQKMSSMYLLLFQKTADASTTRVWISLTLDTFTWIHVARRGRGVLPAFDGNIQAIWIVRKIRGEAQFFKWPTKTFNVCSTCQQTSLLMHSYGLLIIIYIDAVIQLKDFWKSFGFRYF
jgi:hypothetical protein